ncbi:MAG TPA: hypothetical protein VD788_09260, partial [Candidatus Polarisedimenticolaceae bacterium]|nr:hypothetical protein [Candidatus Polarisedimenticolaceae bacterium]
MEKPIRRRRAGQPAQDSEPSSNGATLAGLFLGGLVLRLVHVWTVRESPLFTMPMLDPAMYDEWARALLAGRPPGGVFFQDPLYAYVLAGLYRTLGDGPLVVAIVQSILGAAVAPLVFVAARPSFGVATAGTAGSLAALYAPAIYYDGMLL